MASQFVTVTNKEISQINEEAVPDNLKIVTKFGSAVLQVNLGLFNLNLSYFFCLQMQIKSCIAYWYVK